MHGYFDALRAEVWREGIKITLACPGYVKTAVNANALDAHGQNHSVTNTTHERGIASEHCARAINRAVARGRGEATLGRGGPEIFSIYLKRWLPWLVSRVVRGLKFVTK